ncbi:MAG: hypothetical protein V4612_07335 [Pseudomonadota bacterium]
MTKVIIDLPTDLHRAVKSFTGANGETMKHFFISAAEEKLKYQKTQSKNKISKKKIKDEFISEEEADAMLKPYLIRLVKRINEGKEKVLSEQEFFAELAK